MATYSLVIDGDVKGYFFLSLDGHKLTLSIDPAHPDLTIRNLHAARIRCEIEVADDCVQVSDESAEQDLYAGQAIAIGAAQISLVGQDAAADAPVSEVNEPPAYEPPPLFTDEPRLLDPAAIGAPGNGPRAAADIVRQLVVVEGADKGRRYILDTHNITSIGKSHKHADICLNDLNVARVHCEVQIDGEQVFIRHVEGAQGTLINGQAIADRQELRLGDMLRVGNTQFRLEGEAEQAAAAPRPLAPKKEDGASPANSVKRLLVIDGADSGRSFTLKAKGATRIGKSQKQADICLNDLYVGKLHCELQADGGEILVAPLDEQHVTLVNGQPIAGPTPMEIGEVVRVGNSHLRLELGAGDEAAAEVADESEEELPEALDADEEERPASSDPLADGLAKLEGQTLGHYQLEAALGRGHAGMVFRARDIKTRQVVALKVLSPEFPKNDVEFQGFVRALKVLPQSKHAHLVGLLGAGKTGQHCWIARDYVDGESLADLIERLSADGKLGWKRACRVAYHIGRVLEFLGEHKVVHGNITPRNVLICSDTKITKLADLMLARALNGSQLALALREAKWRAELPYYAPEKLDPRPAQDQRTDLYELGAVLYFMLSGHPPFTGGSTKEISQQIREAKIARPKGNKDMPAAFETIIIKLLARRPQDRFQTAAEFVEMVEPITTMHDIKV